MIKLQKKIDFLKVLRFSFPVGNWPRAKDLSPAARQIYRRNFPPVGFIQSRTVLLTRRQSNPITPHERWLELFRSKFTIELCILCGLYFDFVLSPVLTCIQIQSFGGRFIFLHLSSLPSSDFSGSHVAKKDYRLVLFGARALQSFLFCSVFFHGVCKPCHEPETSGDWTHKYHTALVFITRFLYWTFLYVISLIGIFFLYLFVLTYFDSSRRYTNATTLAAGT